MEKYTVYYIPFNRKFRIKYMLSTIQFPSKVRRKHGQNSTHGIPYKKKEGARLSQIKRRGRKGGGRKEKEGWKIRSLSSPTGTGDQATDRPLFFPFIGANGNEEEKQRRRKKEEVGSV